MILIENDQLSLEDNLLVLNKDPKNVEVFPDSRTDLDAVFNISSLPYVVDPDFFIYDLEILWSLTYDRFIGNLLFLSFDRLFLFWTSK